MALVCVCVQLFGHDRAISQDRSEVVSTGIIFSVAQTTATAEWMAGLDMPPPYWAPGSSEIAGLESKLAGFLRQVTVAPADEVMGPGYGRRKAGESAGKLARYKRQDLG